MTDLERLHRWCQDRMEEAGRTPHEAHAIHPSPLEQAGQRVAYARVMVEIRRLQAERPRSGE